MSPAVLVVVCALLSLVLFYLMAVVSDSFLLPALVALCEVYKIPEDVAGATMLAAGASLPELVSNVVSIYVTKTDIGVGTIVGSEIFNHAAILCAVCAGTNATAKLDPLTCCRDVLGYVGALLLLLVAVSNVKRVTSDDDDGLGRGIVEVRPGTTVPLVLWYLLYAFLCTSRGREKLRFFFSSSRSSTRDVDEDDAFLGGGGGNKETPLLDGEDFAYEESEDADTIDESDIIIANDDEEQRLPTTTPEKKEPPGKDKAQSSSSSWLATVLTLVTAPARAPLWLTLPTEPEKRPHATVVLSLAWLCAQSFAMVVLLEQAADALNITSAVVGLTVGAVGTSFPNLISAAAAARTGKADMAVSASLGANVFNLSVALGLPWLLYPAIHPRKPTFSGMHDANLTVLTLGLLATAVAYAALLTCCRCTLRKAFAGVFLAAYFGFICAALFAQPNLHSIEDREHHSESRFFFD